MSLGRRSRVKAWPVALSRSGPFEAHRSGRVVLAVSHDMGLGVVREAEAVEESGATGRDCLDHGHHRASARVGSPGRCCIEFRSPSILWGQCHDFCLPGVI